ncbi:outer membrane protein assembly factor BamA [Candidatus Pelagibacter sp.]|nr:outer membrane protein assembly factor BamA [Candidatus Pelagibacter sp.]
MKYFIPIKKLILIFVFYFSLIPVTYSEILNSIEINGNERISNESINSFLPIKIGDQVSIQKLNQITKELYETNFFKDVSVEFDNSELIINVIENPIIQNIIFNGIKSNTLKEFIIKDSKLIERSSFVKLFLENDLINMKKNLEERGYYFSKIDSNIETFEDNRVNLIFNFDLGEKAKIRKINFIGNKIFKDKLLKNIILSEEYKFWKFISGKKFLNKDLISFDERLLRNYYLNQGYYNVNISSTFAKVVNESEFDLVFNINAGKKFYFGNLILKLPLNYNKSNFIKLNDKLNSLKNEPYSINSIEKITREIDLLALNEQYETITVNVLETINDNQLNLEFVISESEKMFVRKINVLGNNVTRENVIRNQLEIDEGDFFNEILYNKTINNIKSLNFFRSVTGKVLNTEENNDKIIDITVEEKPTGEIGASVGLGTDNNSVGFFVREGNYLGTGLSVQTNLSLSQESIRGVLSLENPNFKDSDKLVYTSIESNEIDKSEDFGYKTNKSGFSYGTRFEVLEDFFFGIGNSNYYESIDTDSTASVLQKAQEGDYWDSFINLDFINDKRNQRFKPTDGYRSSYSVDIPIISDNNTLSNTFNYAFYTELFENNNSSFSFYLKTANSITNDNIKLTERVYLPSNKLRGFKSGGVGPKDGSDYIGGNFATSVNFVTSIPKIFEQSQSIDANLFVDAANVWGVDYDSSIDKSNDIRSSIGIAIDWLTPAGPLTISISEPITKANTDTTETFRFNLGTTF